MSSSSACSSSSTSYIETSTPSPPPRRHITIQNVPSSLLILPPVAAVIGAFIGIHRGGSRARLRFLAENAHRQPRTVQGWYFYQKTRNYRVMLAASRLGAKYGVALGAATVVYVLVDETVGWAREEYFGVHAAPPPSRGRALDEGDNEGWLKKRVSWRKGGVEWEDGAVAGALLGAGVGTAYRLPRSLFLRSMIIGTLCGGVTSSLQIVQAKVGRLREEEMRKVKAEEREKDLVDKARGDERLDDPQDGVRLWYSGLRAWIPGLRGA